MLRLTGQQSQFLKDYKIAREQVFDATGMMPKHYRSAMKEAGCELAAGATKCGKCGPSLRDTHGRCVMCNTKALGIHRRHRKVGYVYIAFSNSTGLAKVGSSENIQRRAAQINLLAYGGASDWEMLKSQELDEAQAFECEIHALLEPYRVESTYIHEGQITACRELFECTFVVASKAFKKALLKRS